jgi:PEP-CTERM/exosortase A-associated glycosyltransferase
MTRILHVLDHSLPLQSGYTFRTRAILKSQQALGLEVRGITGHRHSADGANPQEVDGLIFHRTQDKISGPSFMREWREITALSRQIESVAREWRPDIIHAHSPALCGFAAWRAARRLGLPLVYEIRAFWEDAAVGNGTGREGSLKYKLTRRLENHVVERADMVFTICHGLRDDLVGRGFDPAKIAIMPNGVDLSLFGAPLSRDEALAAELGIGDGPVIGFIGSFYDYEGIDDLITAIPDIISRHPSARLLLVGGGPMADKLAEQARQSLAADAIRFTGRVPHDEVERYYSLCDIMAYPRKASRLTELVTPLKPLEAMAQDKLVAASDIGGHRELIEDGVTGTLFAPDSPKACAEALSRLLSWRDCWSDMRAAAKAHVNEHHDWSKNAIRYQTVYQIQLQSKPSKNLTDAA